MAAISALHSRTAEFDQSVEHDLQIEGRTADDLEHIGGRRLLLERFGQLLRARLHLVEQPHVLNRDDRLIREGRHQLDLLVRERPQRAARQDDHADRSSFPQQWNPEHAAEGRDFLKLGQFIFRIGEDIRNLNRFAFQKRPATDRAAPRRNHDALHVFVKFPGEAIARRLLVTGARGSKNLRLLRFTQPSRGLQERVEHGLQVEGRAADDLKHVGGRGLLPKRIRAAR